MDAEIQVLLLRDSRTEGFLAAFNSGVVQNTASHASPTANSTFQVHSFSFLINPLQSQNDVTHSNELDLFAYD